MNYKTVFGLLILAVVVLVGVSFINKPTTNLSADTANDQYATEETSDEPTITQTDNTQTETMTQTNEANPVAVVTTNKGTFEIELFVDTVPTTAGNFKKLAEDGFYNGTKFHRVIEGFMIQGGDPLSKDDAMMARWGTGDPGYKFDDEFGEGLSNVTGTISMANSGPNTNGSQFFINVKDNSFLDYDKEPLTSKHSVFGNIISGMDVVMAISHVDTAPNDRPLEPVVIESVVIR